MRVAIGGQISTNRQFHVYVCFEWQAVSEERYTEVLYNTYIQELYRSS